MRNIHILIAVLTLFPLGAIAQAPLSDITTPKESIGFNMGDDYCLANNVQMESYWRTLARESDRMSLEVIGESEGGRDILMAVVTSPDFHCGHRCCGIPGLSALQSCSPPSPSRPKASASTLAGTTAPACTSGRLLGR